MMINSSSVTKIVRQITPLFAIYLFIITLPNFYSVIPGGVDSWMYGISQSLLSEVKFGEDVVFTYGPFGFLVAGSGTSVGLLCLITGFKVFIHLLLFLAFTIKLRSALTPIHKILLTLAFLSAYSVVISTDYQCVLLFLLLLSNERKYRQGVERTLTITLGLFAGFLLLVKFTAGVMSVGALFLCSCGEGLKGTKHCPRPHSYRAAKLFLKLTDILLISATTSVVLLSLANGLELEKFLLSLSLSIFVGCLWMAATWLRRRRLGKNRLSWLSLSVTPQIFAIVILASLPSSEVANFIHFIDYSLEISSGYSSAMSLPGSTVDLAVAITILGMIFALFIWIGQLDSAGFLIALGFIAWVAFKHGFVRQDSHIYIFLGVAPLLVVLAIERASIWALRRSHDSLKLGCSALLIFLIMFCSFPGFHDRDVGNLGWWKTLNHLPSLQRLTNKVTALNVPVHFQEVIEPANHSTFEDRLLDPDVRTYLDGFTVDAIPLDLSLIAANKLSWKPRLTLQSYSNYTMRLDAETAEVLRQNPTDFFLYEFTDVDGRHPFFSEPETLSVLLTKYRLSKQFPRLISVKGKSQLMLLEQASEQLPLPFVEFASQPLLWGEPLSISQLKEVDDLRPLRASVKFKRSFLGKVMKALFREDPVWLHVEYEDGEQRRYRILPTTSENGVLLDPLPRTPEEALSLWQALHGEVISVSSHVSSVRFETSTPWAYSERLELKPHLLERYEVLGERD